MTSFRLVAVAAAGLGLAATTAQAEQPAKWDAHIDVEGKAGSDRNLGEADMFLPVLQNADTLVFADIRTRLDDQSSREGNFGLGIRQMQDWGWNLGAYGFFDRRRSPYANYFNQVTLGAEALSPDWDLRANAYLPAGKKSRLVDSLSTATMSDTAVTFRGGEEDVLKGFDAEIGWRLPMFDTGSDKTLRVYGGGYRFTAAAGEGVPDVTGPRGRLELTFDTVPGLWDGSRFTLGAEIQHDAPRGTQEFLSARLRIPLHVFAGAGRNLSAQEKRMADPIVRDVDVVTRAGAYGAPEAATTANGGNLTVIHSSNTTNLATAITNAGANSTVILSGTFTPANNTTLTLNSGQTVMGAGSLIVRSPSGRTAMLTQSAGATVTTTFTANGGIVAMADNSTLTGVTLNQYGSGNLMAPYGVYANGKTGVTISNNTVYVQHDQNGAFGIYLDNSTGATIRGNSISVRFLNSGGGGPRGIRLSNTSSATIANNTISATPNGGAAMSPVFIAGTVTYLSGSTGNTFSSSGGCNINSGSTSGTLSYTDSNGASQTCP